MNCSDEYQRTTSTVVFPVVASYLLVLSVIQNASLLGPFRLIDLWIWSIFFVLCARYRYFSRAYLLWGLVIFTFAILSSLQGAFTRSLVNTNMLIFYYKYATLFVTLFVVYLVASGEVVFKCKHWNFLFICTSLYLSLHVITFILNNPLLIANSATRVSVPFSQIESGQSNSPMFSVVLAMFALASISALQAPAVVRAPLFILSVIALLLTGSRSGFFVLMLFGLVYFARAPRNVKLFLPVAAIVLFLLVNSFSGDTLAGSLYDRSVNFNFSGDQSANDRMSKQLSAINDVFSNDLWLGIGHEYTNIVWYDGMTGNMVIMFGFWGALLLVFGVIFYFYKLNRRRQFAEAGAKPAFFVGSILVASLISEFVLTSYPLGIVLFISVVATARSQKRRSRPVLYAGQRRRADAVPVAAEGPLDGFVRAPFTQPQSIYGN
jgi:hypothetical protein